MIFFTCVSEYRMSFRPPPPTPLPQPTQTIQVFYLQAQDILLPPFSDNEPASQVLKQVVNLSCYLGNKIGLFFGNGE